jgi:hypothetical protein
MYAHLVIALLSLFRLRVFLQTCTWMLLSVPPVRRRSLIAKVWQSYSDEAMRAMKAVSVVDRALKSESCKDMQFCTWLIACLAKEVGQVGAAQRIFCEKFISVVKP